MLIFARARAWAPLFLGGLLALLMLAFAPGCARFGLTDEKIIDPEAVHEVLAVLDEPAVVYRDERGIPYLHAESLTDVLRLQGFVAARDRLYQMEVERHVASGRLAELIGDRGIPSDRLVRVFDIPRLGDAIAARLNKTERRYYDAYRQGINAYIEDNTDEHPPALANQGIEPTPWTLEEIMRLQLFRIWSSSVNWRQELLTQQLIDRLGTERARELAMLTINPDDESSYPDSASAAIDPSDSFGSIGLDVDPVLAEILPLPDAIGSNAWAVAPSRSASDGPILASDPHIDARTLPGFWHPVGLFTPELRAIGGGTPGTPGLGIGRTADIAFGATNGYADTIDLYIEQTDPQNPDHYLEGAESVPFSVRNEELRVRDARKPSGFRSYAFEVRHTRRGPILTGHGIATTGGHLISARWSLAEHEAGELGSRALLLARSVSDAREAISMMTVPINHVVADRSGRIALYAAGFVPIRQPGDDGSRPKRVVAGEDAWMGFIAGTDMPALVDPERGWVGSANHRILPADYPHVYSTFFSHSWRYRRLKALLDEATATTPETHWAHLRDVHNELAKRIAPVMLAAIAPQGETRELARVLAAWDRTDTVGQPGPAVFQSLYREFARSVFEDDLGDRLTTAYLDDPYYWQERLARMVIEGAPEWFDDQRTKRRETRDELFRAAAIRTRDELIARLGEDPQGWQWGLLHRVAFSAPVRSGDLARRCTAGGSFAARGSGETLQRSIYRYSAPFDSKAISSMRFVADLSDPDKVLGMVPGGVVGRCRDPHLEDQLLPWIAGEQAPWWFSEREIRLHAVSRTIFSPAP